MPQLWKRPKFTKTNAILGCTNMKRKFLPLLLVPMVLTSCGHASISLGKARKIVSNYSTDPLYPYYKVIGSLDFNGELLHVDATFDKTPDTNKFVPYARYNDGFYCENADNKTSDFDILIYAMASRSYWLRAPLRINNDNFFAYAKDKKTGEYTTVENNTCAHSILQRIITSYAGQPASANPSSKSMYMEALPGGGIAFGGDEVHTFVTIDNYPYYPDYDNIPELGEWDEYNPLPCYLNKVNAKVNIRFEYNADGWLVKESMTSLGYNPNASHNYQVSLVAVYSYEFGN